MGIRKTLSVLEDIISGALLATTSTVVYLQKEKYYSKAKKKRKKRKKQIEEQGLLVSVKPSKVVLHLFSGYIVYNNFKKGDTYTILTSAIITLIGLNLFILKKKKEVTRKFRFFLSKKK